MALQLLNDHYRNWSTDWCWVGKLTGCSKRKEFRFSDVLANGGSGLM